MYLKTIYFNGILLLEGLLWFMLIKTAALLSFREEDWSPPLYGPLLFHTHGQGDLAFRMALMNGMQALCNEVFLMIWIYNSLVTFFFFVDDFSGVATTTTFSLGSMIPIAASVAQQNHQPLMLLLDECLASTTPELAPDSRVYPLITNKGYVCRQDVPFLKPKKFFIWLAVFLVLNTL